tara:strand:+ start:1831 stop:2034 length:204 start_codon:yes stop_codon:yes gene_type:complete
MQPIIEQLRQRLQSDMKGLELLAELNEEFLVKEEAARRDQKRVKELEISNDLSNAIIKAWDEGNWHG